VEEISANPCYGIIHNSHHVESSLVFIEGSMDKENVVDVYNRISLSLKKEGNPVIYNSLEDIMLSKIRQTQKDKYYNIPLYIESKNSQFIKAESRWLWVGEVGEWGDVGQCTNVHL
jgi:hypothetical protein